MSTSTAPGPGGFVPGRSLAAQRAAGYLGAGVLPAWRRFERVKKVTATAPGDAGVLVEVLAACAQVRANLDGVEAEALQHLLRVPARAGWQEELAARLALSTRAVQHKLDQAGALGRYMEVHFALLGGQIDAPKARAMIEAVKTLPVGPARAIHRTFLPQAPYLTVGQLRHRLRGAVLAIDADAAHQRHQEAAKDRYVRAEPAEDGMGYLTFYLPATDAAAAMSVLDALAVKTGPEDERPIAARRVDAFMAIIDHILARGAAPDGTPVPTQHGQRPHLVFTIAQSTLDGDDDAPGYLAGYGPLAADIIRSLAGLFHDDEGQRPGTRSAATTTWQVHTDPVDGTAQSVRPGTAPAPEPAPACEPAPVPEPAPACEPAPVPEPAPASEPAPSPEPGSASQPGSAPSPRPGGEPGPTPDTAVAEEPDRPAAAGSPAPPAAAVKDPVATLASMGILASDSYQPGAALRQFILTRDVTCRFPTCRQPGRRCQIDHIVPFDPHRPAWAQTHQGNLHLLCARHHGLKTAGTWTVTRQETTGDTCWTSPLGYTYTRQAEVIDPTIHIPALHRHLDAMGTWHADQPHLWTGAPLTPGVMDETEYARLTCTTHTTPTNCDCAERAEDLTHILRRLQPQHRPPAGGPNRPASGLAQESGHPERPQAAAGGPGNGGKTSHPDPAGADPEGQGRAGGTAAGPRGRPGQPGRPDQPPPGQAPGDLPTGTDPPF